jgi:glycosyltransferase involved in cell wall biosynthesis
MGLKVNGSNALRILVLSKRQYMNRDLLDDRYGRMRELPLELAGRGHRGRGFCLSYATRPEGSIWDGPVRWESINATKALIPGLARFVLRAERLARQVDLIWAGSDAIYGVIAWLLGKRVGAATIFDLYDNFGCFLTGRLPLFRQLFQHALRQCDGVTCNGEALARLIRSKGRSKPIQVIPTVGRTDLFRPLDKYDCRKRFGLPLEGRIAGIAGAIDRNRGIELVFDAFERLKSQIPDLSLALAGPVGKAISVPADSRIRYLGMLPFEQVPLFVNALDVALIPNIDSAFGRYCFPQKAWEIMTCDVPLIAADVEGMKLFFKNHPEWLYDPADAQDLARALKRRLEDRTTGYGTAPTWSDAAAQVERLLLELWAQRPGASPKQRDWIKAK